MRSLSLSSRLHLIRLPGPGSGPVLARAAARRAWPRAPPAALPLCLSYCTAASSKFVTVRSTLLSNQGQVPINSTARPPRGPPAKAFLRLPIGLGVYSGARVMTPFVPSSAGLGEGFLRHVR
eukprot:533673-Hanusia_phi.AAC.1